MAFEGVPGSVIEAAVAGIPVVGFDCYGVREIPGVKARLVPGQDVACLTQALRHEIASLPGTRHGHRQNGQAIEQIQARFNMARMVSETFEIYRQTLKDQSSKTTFHNGKSPQPWLTESQR